MVRDGKYRNLSDIETKQRHVHGYTGQGLSLVLVPGSRDSLAACLVPQDA